MKPDFSKGLIPAIIVNEVTSDILMLAYMNEESFNKTLETKQTWFYSRSRDELWHKGATSGNTQAVQSIRLDCDNDTLLIKVKPEGPACHTGKISCFYQSIDLETGATYQNEDSFAFSIFEDVMAEIEERKQVKADNSYTNYLFDKGIDKIGKKVIEEAGEVVIAAKNNDKTEIKNEISDLIYHSFVLMADQGVSLNQVKQELSNRFSKKGNSKGDRPDIKEW
ncbi:bifunctional phosphoribosyl-AMP cyclohydrolase/phosphoribosyl-ATP diphosphatase HisIE [Aquibacillus rhizosphaerae]|uniref:Histidine biosynthesis bifunctional protein HisIE n=1 Tax=Aquibacillus rhizosphaerae TaxID=3051431 RepID=A0ABT7L313_9BACI|nr:bifunctional phosphoribosyl-AMP cyclohydrolase/phosphoribosyl-ATP diphosphatase HisIE [Aquibacillus sp. LR5S19]MDL4839570.1 bifunctional phosphoribosyl-AMP cyclohydrolase/phosphoribosyl-ATP diphosphatase HisIE [Aquibacillus sp. LR5S19]